MLEQYGTVDVREVRLTRKEVETIVHEQVFHRGPSGYNFDYANPVLVWGQDGGLTIRFMTTAMREEAGRTPSGLRLKSLPEFALDMAKRVEAAKKPSAP